MRQKSVSFFAVLLGLVAVACGQHSEQPKPGPEAKKLAYFIGTWQGKAEVKPSMFGPGGQAVNSSRNEWIAGGFFYLTHHEEQNPSGTYHVVSVTGYDPGKKVYTTYSFYPGGGVERSEGTLAGDTWTWNASYDINGKTVKTRTIIKPTSATSYDFTWEIAANGDDWTTVQQGTAKKAK